MLSKRKEVRRYGVASKRKKGNCSWWLIAMLNNVILILGWKRWNDSSDIIIN